MKQIVFMLRKTLLLVSFVIWGIYLQAQPHPKELHRIADLKKIPSEDIYETLNAFHFVNEAQVDSAYKFVASNLKNPQLAQVKYLLGKRYYSSGVYIKSTKLLTESVAALREAKLFKELADSFHFLGLNSSRLNQEAKAKKYFEECISTAQAHKDTFNVINGLHGIGNLSNKKGEFEQGIKYFEQALNLGLASKDSLSFSYSYDFLSQSYGQIDKQKEALEYQLKALAIREKLGDKFATAISVNNVGECYRLLGQPQKAESFFIRAQEMAKDIGFRDLEAYTYQILTELAEEKGDYKKALQFSKIGKTLSDSLFNTKMTADLAEIEGKYQLSEKERQLSEQKIKNQQQSIYILAFFALTILALVIAYTIYLKKQKEKKLLEQQAQQKLEKERLRIARDLHDHLGPELSLVSSRLDMLSFNNQEQKLAALADVTRGAMDQLRDTIWSIRSEAITIADFAGKVREFANKRLEGTAIQFSDQCFDENRILSPNQALGLFRVCQEAINNVAKYANAQRVELLLHCKENDLIVQLTDDGRGFDPQTVKKGYGLLNMQERIKEMNGKYALESNEKGTSLYLEVPLIISSAI